MSTRITKGERPWGRRARHAVTAVSFVGVASLGLAPSAFAAPGQTSSTGIVCGGVVTCGPFSASAYPAGPASDSAVSATVVGLLSSGTINTAATATGASSSVQNLNVTLGGILPATLTADAVSSFCTIDPTTGAVSGGSTIANGATTQPAVTLSTTPAANSTVSIGTVATLTLNRQTTALDGTLTVDAIYIQILNSTQTITVATSVCGVPKAGIPTVAPGFAVGGGAAAVAALPFAVAWYRRRSQDLVTSQA